MSRFTIFFAANAKLLAANAIAAAGLGAAAIAPNAIVRPARLVDEVHLRVVDPVVEAELLQPLELLVGRRGREGRRTGPLRHLDRRESRRGNPKRDLQQRDQDVPV